MDVKDLKPRDKFEAYGKVYIYVDEGPFGTHYICEDGAEDLILRDNNWFKGIKILQEKA